MASQDMQGIKEADLKLKRVLLRLDLDVPVAEGEITDATRLDETLDTVKWLLESGAKVTACGHLGRPQDNLKWQKDNQYSLKPIYEWYRSKLGNNPNFRMLENLRFDPGEEGNSVEFAKRLVAETGAEVYVFEAFGVSHRKHASVAQIPKLLPTYMGMRFEKEIEALQKVEEGRNGRTGKKRILIIGGAKGETKIPLIEKLAPKFDQILVGGRLPIEIRNSKFEIRNNQTETLNNKFEIAELTQDGLDITEEAAKEFAEIIMGAGVVVWNGPMGKFEEFSHEQGTKIVAKAMNETKAFTVVGGGDTEAALTKFDLEKAPLRQGFEGHGIDWISSGGGAMLTYLAEGTVAFFRRVRINKFLNMDKSSMI